MRRLLIFIFNLVQDVAVARPIIHFARRGFDADLLLLTTSDFARRDASGLWGNELEALREAVGADAAVIATPLDAVQRVKRRRGAVFAASESDLQAHAMTHAVHRALAGSFLTVTLQHGVECVGFLHNRAHDRVHGERVRFGAELVAAWFEGPRLHSMEASQRAKLFVAGPPTLLYEHARRAVTKESGPRGFEGLVCENVHSVRFNAGAKSSFLETLRQFAADVSPTGGRVHLRPHPGGRFFERNKGALPAGVVRNDQPLYAQDLSSFAYGISAPSTILLDLMLAGVPVAVWQDAEGTLDLSNWEGLPVVRDARQWWDFAFEAATAPERLLAMQRRFLTDLRMPQDVASRYSALLRAA